MKNNGSKRLKMEKEDKTLYLPLKREWFEMIKVGEKKEEYRDVTRFWVKRLCDSINAFKMPKKCFEENGVHGVHFVKTEDCEFKRFNIIVFTLGYPKRDDPDRIVTFKCDGIAIGRGRPEWGAPDYDVFIIKIGDRII